MDLQVIKVTFFGGGFRHLKTKRGTDSQETITLDITKFTKATHWPNFYLPAGIVLGKITATGLYGPYAGDVEEQQSITIVATGGTFTITARGSTTAAIAWNATAAQVQTALELLAGIDPGEIAVSGGPGATNPYLLTFNSPLEAGVHEPLVTTTATSLTGGADTAAVVEVAAGGSADATGLGKAVGLLGDRVPINPIFTPSAAMGALQWEGNIIGANLPITPGAAGGGFIDQAAKDTLGSNWRWS